MNGHPVTRKKADGPKGSVGFPYKTNLEREPQSQLNPSATAVRAPLV